MILKRTNPSVAGKAGRAPAFPPDAFTVVELLVAAGITLALAVFMVAMLSNVSGLWTRASGRLSAEGQARYVLEQLTLDLEGALYRDNGKVWLAATLLDRTDNAGTLWDTRGAQTAMLKPAALSLRISPQDTIANDRFGVAGVWLRFFTTKRGSNLDESTLSAPVAVGWQIVRRASTTQSTNADRRYFLHRAEVWPAQTGTVRGTLDAGFDLHPDAATDYTRAGGSTALHAPRSLQVPASPDNIVAENVIDLGIRCYVREPGTGELILLFPTSTRRLAHLALHPPGVGDAATQFPEVVDVAVRVLTDEGARLIAALETGRLGATAPPKYNGDLAQWWWGIAQEHSKVFTRRITIRSQSL